MARPAAAIARVAIAGVLSCTYAGSTARAMASDACARAYRGSRAAACSKSTIACWTARAPRRLNSSWPCRKSAWASGSAVSARAAAAVDGGPSDPSRVDATVRAISSCTANTFVERPVVLLGPAHGAVDGRQQRHVDAQVASGVLDRAGEQRADAELSGDRALIEALGLKRRRTHAPDDPHPVLGEGARDLFGEADAEIVIRLVAAEVRQREHGNGSLRRLGGGVGRAAGRVSGHRDRRVAAHAPRRRPGSPRRRRATGAGALRRRSRDGAPA